MKEKGFSDDYEPHFLIFLGERLRDHEILIHDKPGFMDATRLAGPPPLLQAEPSYQFILLQDTINVTLHFQERRLSKQFQFIFQENSLRIIEMEYSRSSEAFLSIFHYFLIKNGNHVSFLLKFPEDKIKKPVKKLSRCQSEEKDLDE